MYVCVGGYFWFSNFKKGYNQFIRMQHTKEVEVPLLESLGPLLGWRVKFTSL